MNKLDKKINVLLENTGDMALKRRAKLIVNNLELKDKLTVLDVGCGDGYYLHLLNNLPYKLQLTGTDYDEKGLKKARINLGKRIPLCQGDLMKKLPFKARTFDRVVMSEVTEHLPNDVKGLSELHRVMKKNGVICLTVPCLNYPFLWDPLNWVLQRIGSPIRSGFFAGIWNQHERLYTQKQLTKVVEKAGFKVEVCQTTTWWCLPFNHYIVNIIARLLAHGNLSGNTKASLNKFTKNPQRPWYLNFAFNFVNKLDQLNDGWKPKDRGVGVFIKARA